MGINSAGETKPVFDAATEEGSAPIRRAVWSVLVGMTKLNWGPMFLRQYVIDDRYYDGTL